HNDSNHSVLSKVAVPDTSEDNCNDFHDSANDSVDQRITYSSSDSEFSASTSENEMNSDNSEEFHAGLRSWALKCDIKACHLTELLKFLKLHPRIPSDLPVDSRTFLKTPTTVKLHRESNIEYFQYAVCDQVKKALEKGGFSTNSSALPDVLCLSLNVDGLPVFKSSRCTFWPVLAKLHVEGSPVFPLMLSSGPGKPYDSAFLPILKEVFKEVRRFCQSVILAEIADFLCKPRGASSSIAAPLETSLSRKRKSTTSQSTSTISAPTPAQAPVTPSSRPRASMVSPSSRN
ncbi:hypothetical protein CAPTEDRAFT_188192, partial [Capitella teleta]